MENTRVIVLPLSLIHISAAKNKGDDNDTCNGLVNGQALLNLDYLSQKYHTMDFDTIIEQTVKEG